MSDSTRRILITCLMIAVVVCLCAAVVAVIGAAVFMINRSSVGTIPPTVIAVQVPTNPLQTEQVSSEAISPEVAAQMDEIQNQVIQIRDLQPSSSVARQLLTPDQLRQHVLDNFLKDYTPEDAQNDVKSLAAFGFLQPDFDLLNFYINLYSEQVAGYYDNEAKEMFVVAGQGFEGPERMTYAHEYTHALQDQNYDIKNGLDYSEEACKTDSERCAAVQSLLEGDASTVEVDWLTTDATTQDKQQITEFYNTFQSPVYDSAPEFMRQDFVFPYQNGQAFVQYLYDKGGWNAVDQAYKTLPASTEQILHPEKYPQDVPMTVSLPDLGATLGIDYREVDSGTLGEWYTTLMLAYGLDAKGRLDLTTAQTAAAGWGGDAYAVYYDDQTQSSVLVLSMVWDTQKDADEFSSAFQQYASGRFNTSASQANGAWVWDNGQVYNSLEQNGSQTVWILAPDAATAGAVWAVVKP
jgi:hypothetical protein